MELKGIHNMVAALFASLKRRMERIAQQTLPHIPSLDERLASAGKRLQRATACNSAACQDVAGKMQEAEVAQAEATRVIQSLGVDNG